MNTKCVRNAAVCRSNDILSTLKVLSERFSGRQRIAVGDRLPEPGFGFTRDLN